MMWLVYSNAVGVRAKQGWFPALSTTVYSNRLLASFDAGLYEELCPSQRVTCSRWPSALHIGRKICDKYDVSCSHFQRWSLHKKKKKKENAMAAILLSAITELCILHLISWTKHENTGNFRSTPMTWRSRDYNDGEHHLNRLVPPVYIWWARPLVSCQTVKLTVSLIHLLSSHQNTEYVYSQLNLFGNAHWTLPVCLDNLCLGPSLVLTCATTQCS